MSTFGRPGHTTAVLTLFFFVSALLPVNLIAGSAEDGGRWLSGFPRRFFRRIRPPKKEITHPDELQALFDNVSAETFNENNAQRDEKASLKRPAKQVSLAVMDGQIGIVKQYLSYSAARTVARVGSGATETAAWRSASEVVSRMTRPVSDTLNTILTRSEWGRNLFAFLGKNSPGFRKALLREGNFALMALIAVLITSGVYDGLDVDSMKDHVIAVAPLASDYTYDKKLPATILQGFVSRQLYAGFNGAFDRLYKKALANRTVLGKALADIDKKAAQAGHRLFKATRVGSAPAAGPSLAERMGLVGVGEGVQFTLSGLVQRLATGTAFALGGDLLIESTGAMVRGFKNRHMLGGNRNHYYVRQDLNQFQFQHTGKPLKDWWLPRQKMLRDILDARYKWPVTKLAVPITTMFGGYLGSVAAGAIFAGGGAATLVGGTLVSTLFAGVGAFVGKWLAVKTDRGKAMTALRKRNFIRRITREIKQMPVYRCGGIDNEQLGALAEARAADFEKIEKVGQVSKRIFIVDDRANIRLERRGDYVKMVVDDEHGSKVNRNADVRYDFIDLAGNRFCYDIRSNSFIDVGKVAQNNGRYITFVNGKSARVEGDVIVNDPDTAGLHVYENGIILEKQEDATWVVRGQGADSDIFFRDTGERFEWRDKAFRRVAGPADADRADDNFRTAGDGRILEPLSPFLRMLDESSDENLHQNLVSLCERLAEKAKRKVFARIDGIEDPRDAVKMTHIPLKGDLDASKAFLRARLQRYIENASEKVLAALSELDASSIRDKFQRAASETSITRSTLSDDLEYRLRVFPVAGLLSVLVEPEALTSFALAH